MRIRVLKTEQDHDEAIAELDRLMDLNPEEGTKEYDDLELLALLIDQYEREAFPHDDVTPIDLLHFIMEQHDLQQKDLAPYLGSASKVSEVLNGKRQLSLSMIQRLHEAFLIPVELLITKKDLKVA